jgi:hypothetical protein
MAMVSPKELRQLVNRLEAEAASHPWLYKMRVLALALLGSKSRFKGMNTRNSAKK